MFDEREPAEADLTPELKAMEGTLARLVPAGARVDRDRLMFEAGRASAGAEYGSSPSLSLRGRGSVRMWRGAASLMTAASLVLAVSLARQRHSFEVALKERAQVVPIVQVAKQQPANAAPVNVRPELAADDWTSLRRPAKGYLGIRYAALTRGVNAIDTRPSNSGVGDSTGAMEQTQREMLDELMPSAKSKKHSKS